jgi:hypothetical protein
MGRARRLGPTPRRARSPRADEAGQAQIELVASLPLLIAVAAVALQLMAVGHAQSLADGSAEAAALAVAAGRGSNASDAARAALPDWAEDRSRVDVENGSVAVALRPPTLIPGAGRLLEVRSTAWAQPPGGERAPR